MSSDLLVVQGIPANVMDLVLPIPKYLPLMRTWVPPDNGPTEGTAGSRKFKLGS